MQATTTPTSPLVLNQLYSQAPSSVKKNILIDPEQVESSRSNSVVTSTPHRCLLPYPIVSSISPLGQTRSVNRMILVDSEQWESSQLNNTVTLTPHRPSLPVRIEPSITPTDNALQQFAQFRSNPTRGGFLYVAACAHPGKPYSA